MYAHLRIRININELQVISLQKGAAIESIGTFLKGNKFHVTLRIITFQILFR